MKSRKQKENQNRKPGSAEKGNPVPCVFCKICMMLCIFAVCGFTGARTASAASCDITLEVEESEVAVGTEFYLAITVTSEDAIGDLEAYFTYNNKVVEFVTGGTVAADRKEYFQLTDVGSEEGSLRKKYAVKFKALKRGSSSFTVMEPCAVYAADTGEAMSVSSNMTSVTVKKTVNVSQNEDSDSALPSETAGEKMDTTLEEDDKEEISETGGGGVVVTPEDGEVGVTPEDSEASVTDDTKKTEAANTTSPQISPAPGRTAEKTDKPGDGAKSLILFLSLTIFLAFAGFGIFIAKRLR